MILAKHFNITESRAKDIRHITHIYFRNTSLENCIKKISFNCDVEERDYAFIVLGMMICRANR